MPSCGKARAMSADSRGRSEAGAAPSNWTARDKLGVAAVGRRIRLVRPVHQKARGDDQMQRGDRDDDQRCDLAADAAKI